MDDIIAQLTELTKQFPNFKNGLNEVIDSFRKFKEAGGITTSDISKNFSTLLDKIKTEGPESVNTVITSLKTLATDGVKALEGLDEGFSSLINTVSKISEVLGVAWGDIKDGLDGVTNETFQATTSFLNLAAAAGKLNAVSLFSGVISDVEKTNSGLNNLLTFADGWAQKMGIVGLPIGMMKNIMEASSAAKQFETALYQAAAASGALSNLFTPGNLASGLDEVADQIQTTAAQSALRMNISYQSSIEKTIALLKILPQEFEKNEQGIEKFYKATEDSGPVSAMTLLQTVSTGTGVAFNNVAEIASKMFSLFNFDAKEAAERVSLLNRVSSDLKIPFGSLKDTIQGIDEAFKMWGSNAEDALGILEQISSVLKEQGVGYEAQLQIVRTLSSAINSLSIEKKAFIGMEAGLQGSAVSAGLQVEKMLQDGNLGEVANMLQETLGQIGGAGGRILSLDDALSVPGQEHAFLAQRMALGQIFGVQDVGEQNRLMEVMSKVSLGTESQLNAGEALKEAFGKGEIIQQKQFNMLENIYTEQVAIRQVLASREAYQQERTFFGRGSPETMTDQDYRVHSQAMVAETQTPSIDTTTPEGRARATLNFDFTGFKDITQNFARASTEVGQFINSKIGDTSILQSKINEDRNNEIARLNAQDLANQRQMVNHTISFETPELPKLEVEMPQEPIPVHITTNVAGEVNLNITQDNNDRITVALPYVRQPQTDFHR